MLETTNKNRGVSLCFCSLAHSLKFCATKTCLRQLSIQECFISCAPPPQVRNAASLAFTALVMRVIGLRNPPTQTGTLKPWQAQLLPAALAAGGLQLSADDAAAVATAVSRSGGAASKGGWCMKSPTAADFFARWVGVELSLHFLFLFIFFPRNNLVVQNFS
jgi:hypothetical protein